jgi:hypothetical protein
MDADGHRRTAAGVGERFRGPQAVADGIKKKSLILRGREHHAI